MKTKFLLVLAFVLCLAMPALAQTTPKKDDKMMKSDDKMSKMSAMDKTLMDKEQMVWKTIQAKRFDDFTTMLAANYMGVYATGVQDKNAEIAQLKQVSFSNLMFSDMRITYSEDKNTAIVTSLVSVDAAAPTGQSQPLKLRTSTVWTKQGKNWVILYHTDNEVK